MLHRQVMTMLKVARQTDYAARIILHLARLGGGMTTIARISQLDRLPDSFVRRLVARMEKGGLLVTLRGKKGGVRLARPAGEISLLDVVNVMERPLVPAGGRRTGPGRTTAARNPILAAWQGASQVMQSSLAAIRFDRFLGEPCDDGMAPAPCDRLLPTGS